MIKHMKFYTLTIILLLFYVFTGCSDDDSGSSATAPTAPGAATVVSGNAQLALSWSAVANATAYEVWYHTANDSSEATRFGSDITATTTVLTGLNNGTMYYLWLKAKNSAGTSGFGPVASGTPSAPPVPGESENVTAGSVQFDMICANDGTSIIFPFSSRSATPADDTIATNSIVFFIAETEVTWKLWKIVYDWATNDARGANKYTFQNPGKMGSAGSGDANMTDQHPVTEISWHDAVIWCNALSEMTGVEAVYIANGNNGTTAGDILRNSVTTNYDGKSVKTVVQNEEETVLRKGFRLPTSKEWEFAARYVGTNAAGRTYYISQGVNGGHADLTAGYYWNPASYASGATNDYHNEAATRAVGVSMNDPDGAGRTWPVKGKAPNALGLYDMSGNVMEWVFVDYDPWAVVRRGGSWLSVLSELQTGYWQSEGLTDPVFMNRGFRLAKSR